MVPLCMTSHQPLQYLQLFFMLYVSLSKCDIANSVWTTVITAALFGIYTSLEYCYRWLRPVSLDAAHSLLSHRPAWSRSRGCVQVILHPLRPAYLQIESGKLIQMMLLNMILVERTSILNNFISTYDLDFYLMTETWVKPGDNSPFSELLPPS